MFVWVATTYDCFKTIMLSQICHNYNTLAMTTTTFPRQKERGKDIKKSTPSTKVGYVVKLSIERRDTRYGEMAPSG